MLHAAWVGVPGREVAAVLSLLLQQDVLHVVVFVQYRRQLRKQKHEQEQREFEALQEQGLNPYQVYRVRSQEAAAAKAAAALEAVQQQRRAKLAASLASEESTYRKQLARAEFDKQVCKTGSSSSSCSLLCCELVGSASKYHSCLAFECCACKHWST